MIDLSPDWLAALAILLLPAPALALYYRYGGEHLRHPVRLGRLFRRVGADFARLPIPRRNVATFVCNNCDQTKICRAWLHGTETTGYRAFCPNANIVDWLAGSPIDAEPAKAFRLGSASASDSSPDLPPVAG